MSQLKRTSWLLVLFVGAFLLAPMRVVAQSGTVTDDAFASSNASTQLLNLKGQGISLIVAGSSATVGSIPVGLTKSYIKFQLQSSLPPNVAAVNVQKATLKLFLSPSCSPTGAIDIYPVTSAWTESTLTPSAQPTLAASPFASDALVGTDLTFMLVDVTQLVQDWIEGPSNGGLANDGIALVAHTSSTYAVFDSKESIITSHEPRLEIVLANSGPQGPQGPAGAQGPQGATGTAGAPGTAATIAIGSVNPVAYNAAPAVMNTGTTTNAVLNFLIPGGQTGATGATGPIGPQGPVGINNKGQWSSGASYNPNDAVFDSASYWLALQAIPANTPNSEPSPTNANWQLLAGGIVNRGPWSSTNNYNVNDAVSDAGSYWLAVVPTSATANPPTSCEPSQATCASDWQLLAAQGAQGPQGQTGPQGQQGIQGLMGFPGPPGPVPPNVAVTNANNNFTTPQTVGGNVSITGPGNGLVFPDGTVQTTAATALGGGATACFASSAGPNTCPVVLSGSSTPPMGYWPLNSVTTPVLNPTWIGVSRPPTGLRSTIDFGIAAANGLLYIMGGNPPTEEAETASYDPTTDTWTISSGVCGTLAGDNVACPSSPLPVLPKGRRLLAAAAANGPVRQNLYAIGGFDTSNKPTPEVDVYNPDLNTWTAVTSIPHPTDPKTGATSYRAYFGAANLNGQIYVAGGETIDPATGASAPDPTVLVYNPASNSWGGAAPMPTLRERFAVAVTNGKLYAIGGDIIKTGAGGVVTRTITRTVDVYDLQTDSWSTAAPFPQAVEFTGTVADSVNGLIYVNVGSQTYIYDPVADAWTKGPTGALSGGTVAIGGSLYSVGGDAEVLTIAQTTYSYVKVCNVPGQGICAQTCIDETSDPNNCGGCRITCKPPANGAAACTNGTCSVGSCNSGFTACSNACVNLQNDPNNCNACGNICATPNGAISTCTAGACGFACAPGFADCDGNPANGCEVHTAADINNCGGCGIVCPARANALTACTNSACGFACAPGFADCDGNPANGCEVNLQSDPNNCLSCGTVCAAGQVCTPGGCFTQLPSGSPCGNNANCISGVCVIPPGTSGGTCQ